LIRDPASGEKPTLFTCAGDEAARSIVIALANEIGLEGVDAGHLDASRNIENLDLLVGQLAYGSGFSLERYLPDPQENLRQELQFHDLHENCRMMELPGLSPHGQIQDIADYCEAMS
jgi:hypothetical protein